MDNKISFQSKINFVDQKTFDKIITKSANRVSFDSTAPLYVKGDSFYTTNIRTCTAGGLKSKSSALGFHILDNLDNCQMMYKTKQYILDGLGDKPTGGLLVGGKRIVARLYSMEIFQEMLDFMKKKAKNITVFQEHVDKLSETNYFYDLKSDTWTLSTGFIDNDGKYAYVKSFEELKKCFKKIIISDNDELFINDVKVNQEEINKLNISQ